MKVKKYLISTLTALVMAVSFAVPSFADVGVGSFGISDNAFHSVFALKFDKHESVTVADVDPAMKEYSGGMIDSQLIAACASCHIDNKSKHKAISRSGWRKGRLSNNDGYKLSYRRSAANAIWQPG